MQVVTPIGLTPYEFETLTVTSAAAVPLGVGLDLTIPKAVFITIETWPIRFRLDSTVPTNLIGHNLPTTQNLWLDSPAAIRGFRGIGVGGNSVASITYYR